MNADAPESLSYESRVRPPEKLPRKRWTRLHSIAIYAVVTPIWMFTCVGMILSRMKHDGVETFFGVLLWLPPIAGILVVTRWIARSVNSAINSCPRRGGGGERR